MSNKEKYAELYKQIMEMDVDIGSSTREVLDEVSPVVKEAIAKLQTIKDDLPPATNGTSGSARNALESSFNQLSQLNIQIEYITNTLAAVVTQPVVTPLG